jgi:hypothetical protein
MKQQRHLKFVLGSIAMAAFILLLAGCANTKAPSLYGWRNYEKNLDNYFRSDKTSMDEQLKSMQDDQQILMGEGKSLPPGYRAHMGLLYGRKGDLESFRNQMEAEKQHFPDSSGFMDFLMRNFKKP